MIDLQFIMSGVRFPVENGQKKDGIMKPFSTTNANPIMPGNQRGEMAVPTVQNTGDAVGVSSRRWVVAIVNNNSEKAYADKLGTLGYEAYVPMQREIRQYRNERNKMVDRVVLPALLLLRVTEEERNEVVNLPYIYRFMTDRAAAKDRLNRCPIATIPDNQVATLKFMLYNSDTPVRIESMPLNVGDKVRVVRGKLQGLVGNVMTTPDGKSTLTVSLDILGCARVQIDTTDIAPVD